MQYQFQLNAPLAHNDLERLFHAFRPLAGVRRIEASPGSPDVTVQFDEHATSLGEVARAAAEASLREPARAGGCCGGCCGG